MGNTSETANLPYILDLSAPKTSYRITGPSYQERSDIYITKDSRVEFSAADDLSGVDKISYQPEDASEPVVYSSPAAFPQEGRRLVRYWSTDHVGNRELERAMMLITDNTGPEIFANFSLTPVGKGSDGEPVYRRSTALFLGATDDASGVRKIYYQLNGGKETEYTTPVVLDHTGSFNLVVRAVDYVGNESTKPVSFSIKE